ncbi:MAG TPA: glycerophosphodiester phosphodiesterase family protein [Nocardioides sp.]|nr:glycerophosphodiester phosphodiesterase family protein [Nocardioides sp.]
MRPQVVAHRGASEELAEHTLGAYLEALDVGAEGLECDVRLTADGHLVCVHDRDLRRTAATKGLVSQMELADLSDLDFAAWKNPWADLDDEAPDEDENLRGVLTLRKLLETVADYPRRVEVAIETKHPTRYSGLVEKRLVEMLREFGWHSAGAPVRVMSFSNTALQRVQRLAPELRLVQLVDRPSYWPVLKRTTPPEWILGPGIKMLEQNPRTLDSMVRTGRDMHVWTVNHGYQLKLCQDAGVTAIITDRPKFMLGLLGQ